MRNVALCKCGIDMTNHFYGKEYDELENDPDFVLPEGFHYFDAAGTRHRCEEFVQAAEGTFLCPRPAYHKQEGVSCGPLTGKKLW